MADFCRAKQHSDQGFARGARLQQEFGGREVVDAGMTFGSVEEVESALRSDSYLADRGLATAVYLALAMQRPLLLEGEAGVGKTEVGKTLARLLGGELIRLRCYEGIDSAQALYEWDYAKQLLYTRALLAGEVRA